MKFITFEDVLDVAEKENMLEIWMEFENESLSGIFTYGFDGGSYYRLMDRFWSPLYINNYEKFIEYVEKQTHHYNGSCLLKIK